MSRCGSRRSSGTFVEEFTVARRAYACNSILGCETVSAAMYSTTRMLGIRDVLTTCQRFPLILVVSEHMRFTPQFLDELRARLPVSEVVGRRVKLKKAGREWKGLSPFQQEKSPSFTVNDQKGFYHDFSSGKHGDIISFLMETEGVGFTEAVERLASMAGMALARRHAGCGAARAAPQDAVRRDGTRREILRRHAGVAHWGQGARLSRRPRDFAGHPIAVSHRLRDGRSASR